MSRLVDVCLRVFASLVVWCCYVCARLLVGACLFDSLTAYRSAWLDEDSRMSVCVCVCVCVCLRVCRTVCLYGCWCVTVCFPHGLVCSFALLATRVYVCLVSLVCCLPTCVCVCLFVCLFV